MNNDNDSDSDSDSDSGNTDDEDVIKSQTGDEEKYVLLVVEEIVVCTDKAMLVVMLCYLENDIWD